MQRVAQPADVTPRVDHLRDLARRVASQHLVLADALYAEHVAGLWQYARTPQGDPYEAEEQFWEEAVGVRRRAAYQLIALGRLLSKLRLTAADRTALAAVGLHKMDLLVPILKRQATIRPVRGWIAVAQTCSRKALRERVREALGRPGRPVADHAAHVQAYLVNAMPDLESRDLAAEFFTVGATFTGTDNAVAILIAAMQETLGTWSVHLAAADEPRNM